MQDLQSSLNRVCGIAEIMHGSLITQTDEPKELLRQFITATQGIEALRTASSLVYPGHQVSREAIRIAGIAEAIFATRNCEIADAEENADVEFLVATAKRLMDEVRCTLASDLLKLQATAMLHHSICATFASDKVMQQRYVGLAARNNGDEWPKVFETARGRVGNDAEIRAFKQAVTRFAKSNGLQIIDDKPGRKASK